MACTCRLVAARGGTSPQLAAVPPPRREEVEVRKLDALLAASDARIMTTTVVPGAKAEGEAKPRGAAPINTTSCGE